MAEPSFSPVFKPFANLLNPRCKVHLNDLLKFLRLFIAVQLRFGPLFFCLFWTQAYQSLVCFIVPHVSLLSSNVAN